MSVHKLHASYLLTSSQTRSPIPYQLLVPSGSAATSDRFPVCLRHVRWDSQWPPGVRYQLHEWCRGSSGMALGTYMFVM
jgi:hypothetical protein